MEAVTAGLEWLNGIVWGVPMLILILGIGLYLTIGLRARSILRVPLSLAFLWRGRVSEGKDEITPFNALMTELSATIGTGNIAGVATAIFLGGGRSACRGSSTRASISDQSPAVKPYNCRRPARRTWRNAGGRA